MKTTLKSILTATILATSLVGTALADDFIITTGGEGGGYERLGHMFASHIKKQKRHDLEPEVVNSTGSLENIECINLGDCHAAIVQMDALNLSPPKIPVKTKPAHTEYVYWLYNKEYNYTDIEDIEGKEDLYITVGDGSGSRVTLDSFAQEDSGYKVNVDNAIYVDDLYEAVSAVADGRYNNKKVVGTVYVGSTIPAEIAEDFKSKVWVGEATDGDFNDAKDLNGEPLYFNCEVNKGNLRGMNTSTWSNPDTVCVKASIIFINDLEKDDLKAVKKAATKAVRGL